MSTARASRPNIATEAIKHKREAFAKRIMAADSDSEAKHALPVALEIACFATAPSGWRRESSHIATAIETRRPRNAPSKRSFEASMDRRYPRRGSDPVGVVSLRWEMVGAVGSDREYEDHLVLDSSARSCLPTRDRSERNRRKGSEEALSPPFEPFASLSTSPSASESGTDRVGDVAWIEFSPFPTEERSKPTASMSLRSVIETISELGNGFLLALWIVAVSLLIWTRRKGNRTAAGKGDADSHGAEKAPDPVHCGKITLEALRNFDGRDPDKPLYVAIRGKVYDVTRGKDFYGPGCAYSCFTGRDASRALAKMSFTEEDLSGTADGLSAAETQILDDWEMKFQSKYTHVGTVIALRDA